MSVERDAALSYIRRVLGMQPTIRAQLALREQQVDLLTAEVEEARARLATVLAECDRLDSDRAAGRVWTYGDIQHRIRQAATPAP